MEEESKIRDDGKEKEIELEKRIIVLRKAKCNGRRGLLTEAEKPAEKRRKINEEEWKRVIPIREEEQRKRKEKGDEKEPELKRRKTKDIREYMNRDKEDEKSNQDDLEAQKPAADKEAHMPTCATGEDLQAQMPPSANDLDEKEEDQQQPTNVTEEDLEAGMPTEASDKGKAEPADCSQEPDKGEVRFGEWEVGSFMEEDSWEKHSEKRKRKLEKKD